MNGCVARYMAVLCRVMNSGVTAKTGRDKEYNQSEKEDMRRIKCS